MIDNFDIARQWMKFDSDDEFFFIQVLVRGKDGNKANGNNTNRTIKYYTVRSLDEFNAIEQEIKYLCSQFNTRAYIHYSKRSFKQVGREMLRDVTDKLPICEMGDVTFAIEDIKKHYHNYVFVR